MISHGKNIKIFSGNSHPALAMQIASALGLPIGKAAISTFLAVQIQMPANLVHLLHQAPAKLGRLFGKADENILLHRHVREQHGLLRHHVDTGCQGHRGARKVQLFPFYINVALVLLVDAHDDLHQRAFARAVAADEGQHFPRAHGQINALQHGVQAERFANALHRKQRCAAGLCALLRHLPFSLPKKVYKSFISVFLLRILF